jgi:hypothetical protein
MVTTQNGETEEQRAARLRRVRVPGLLLISAAGETYFIEGGIRANKVRELDLQNLRVASGSSDGSYISAGLCNRASLGEMLLEPERTLRKRLGFVDRTYSGEPASVEQHNVGPMLMQAYSVFLERDEASEGEITGNAHDLRMA